MQHKHTVLEIQIKYTRTDPAEVLGITCKDCSTAFPELMKLYQDRENEQFKLMGNRSSVIFFNPNYDYAKQKTWMYKEELELKLVPSN